MRRWQMIAASVPGASHLARGLPCQDTYRVEEVAKGGMIAALADGLGSARCAERGAQVAVDTAVITLRAALNTRLPKREKAWRRLLPQAFGAAHAALSDLAANNAAPLADYATTLLVAVVTRQWLAVGQIGDGAVVTQLEDVAVLVGRPQRGEFANETQPLTAVNALATVSYCYLPRPTAALALLSDGLQQLCIGAIDYVPHQPFFAPLFAQIRRPVPRYEAEADLIRFLQSERVNQRSDDDKTLVLLGQVG